jgi:hypothetical protein
MSRAVGLDRDRGTTVSIHIGDDSFRLFAFRAEGEGDGCAVGGKAPYDLGADPS